MSYNISYNSFKAVFMAVRFQSGVVTVSAISDIKGWTSTAGLIVNWLCTCLSPEHVDTLFFYFPIFFKTRMLIFFS